MGKKATDWIAGIKSLYETFVFRDLLGYVLPGLILLGGSKGVWTSVSWSDVPRRGIEIVILAAVAYLVSHFMRLVGTWPLGMLCFHGKPKKWIKKFLRQCPEAWETPRREVLPKVSKEEKASVVEREIVLLHLTGLVAIALSAVSLQLLVYVILECIGGSLGCSLIRESASRLLRVGAISLGAVVFFLGHYRHAHQLRVIRGQGSLTRA